MNPTVLLQFILIYRQLCVQCSPDWDSVRSLFSGRRSGADYWSRYSAACPPALAVIA